ncbi:ester hydrolase C11orf54 homolog isoform 2-T2 [Pholidichthys leucotaenia]
MSRTEKVQLHTPDLEELQGVLQTGLEANFAEVQVAVVECPDLSREPFHFPVRGDPRRVMEHETRSPEPTSTGTSSHAWEVSVNLPDFWQDNPRCWFHVIEAQFAIWGVTADDTKFYHVVAALDGRTARHVGSLLDQPPTGNRYEALKAALTQRYTLSDSERAERLLTRTELGDGSAVDLMEKMLALRGTDDEHFLFAHLFLRTLPTAARAALANSPLLAMRDYRALAWEADRIINATRTITVNTAAAEPGETTRGGEEPPTAAAAGAKEREGETLCFYHRRFGEKARRCVPPCQFKRSGNAKTRGR